MVDERRPRILHIIKGLGPGGAERLLVSFAAAADHDLLEHSVLYLLNWKSHLVPDLRLYGVEARCLGVRSEKDLRWVPRLRTALQQIRPDVVHVHSPLVAAAARVVARTIRPAPLTVATEHNVWPSYAHATRLLNALTFRLDAHHFAVSDQVTTSVRRSLRDDVETLTHGVPVKRLRADRRSRHAVREELGLADDQIAVAIVANYRVQKDYPTLLAAARQIADEQPEVRFVIVGQGPLEEAIEREHARLGLDSTVSLLGYRSDALDVMAAADIFALSSIQEGLPVALMEALVLGLPIVATAVGGIPSAVTDGVEGVLVPPRRPDLLAAGILRLVANPAERRRLGDAARRRGDEFDAGRSVRRLEEVYRMLVSTSRRSSRR